MPLPERTVESIFASMLVRYGAAWMRMWEGVDEDVLKGNWALELGAFAAKPRAIEHALMHLPADRPPNVAQFAQLCISAPELVTRRLAAPQIDAAKRAEFLEDIRAGFAGRQQVGELQSTLRGLEARQAQGLPLTQFQRETLRELQARAEGMT